jgi:hypothetical protein
MLNKKSDDDKDRDEDLEDQTNLQDDNDDELVSVEENINRELEKALELFKLFQ